MIVGISIFQEFNLPNSTTWFYFSLLLAIALFFRFTRFLSVRNLDVVALFVLVPGLLLLLEAQTRARVASEAAQGVANLLMESAAVKWRQRDSGMPYCWAAKYRFVRHLLDVGLDWLSGCFAGRPSSSCAVCWIWCWSAVPPGPNLSPSGLIWLSLALSCAWSWSPSGNQPALRARW